MIFDILNHALEVFLLRDAVSPARAQAVVLAAVRSDGVALAHAAEELRADRDVRA